MAARKLRKRKDGVKIVSDSDAVWQYILDHSRYIKGMGYTVSANIPVITSREDFERRLKARKEGLYRYTEEDLLNQKPIRPKIKKGNGIRRKIRKVLMWLIELTT